MGRFASTGRDGRTLYSTSGAPATSLGSDGDFAIDTTPSTAKVYGPKASGSWPSGVSLETALTWTNFRTAINTVTAKGTVTTGTVTFDVSTSFAQSITNGGAHTWAFSNWPTGYGEITIACTNGGAFTITLPTINWYKGDGTSSTTFSSMSVTLKSSGLNVFVIWSYDGGTTLLGRAL